LLGKTVRRIQVLQVDRRGLHAMTEEAADAIVRGLSSRTGQPLELRKVTADIGDLWHARRLAVRAFARADGDQVTLFFIVEREVQVYERVEFQGLRHLERSEVDSLLGLYPDRQVTSVEAVAMRNILVARYRRDGYAFCSIALDEREPGKGESSGDRARKIVTFRIDEGPKVTVGEVNFRGNVSFPAETSSLVSAGDHLVREAHIQQTPAGWLTSGGAYSREVLEEDLDRLQLFYRSRGFLDATVAVTDVHFRGDYEVVDLDFLVVEGPRYVIKSLRIVHVDEAGRELPPGRSRYPPEEVMAVLFTKVGDFYDHLRTGRDRLAIEDFYGRRGHPKASFPGMARVPGAFSVGWPRERYDEQAAVELTFEVHEGTEKTLRDIVIRGNTGTRDKVIRRKIQVLPGERVDMHLVARSIANLDRTRFFQDPMTLAGPRFELLEVPGRDDMLDLAVDVTESETGEVRWGVGITTGAGAQGTLQFIKRNFDLWSPPSSWNPITMFEEILDNRAFHGGGQNLDLLLAPGTQVSQFQIGFTEPDVFGEHFDTTELRVNGRRTLRYRDGYRSDTLGCELGLSRNLTDELQVGVSFREESIEIDEIAPDATSIVFDAEGQTELRGPRVRAYYREFDDLRRPSAGLELQASYEMLGGLWGAEEDLWKINLGAHYYVPIAENALGHRSVLHVEQAFGVAEAFGSSNDVFVTERFYLGGLNLRGFDFRGVGPSQNNRPFGGEAIYYGSFELSLPLVATRLERDLRDRELLRGVVFVDYGLLGLSIDDPTFHELRVSYGVGLLIDVPVLDIPIALYLGWPVLYEETDERRQFTLNISRR
jgi:outer membrane protein assembly factor BamA